MLILRARVYFTYQMNISTHILWTFISCLGKSGTLDKLQSSTLSLRKIRFLIIGIATSTWREMFYTHIWFVWQIASKNCRVISTNKYTHVYTYFIFCKSIPFFSCCQFSAIMIVTTSLNLKHEVFECVMPLWVADLSCLRTLSEEITFSAWPKIKFIGTAKTYLVCHISPKFQFFYLCLF